MAQNPLKVIKGGLANMADGFANIMKGLGGTKDPRIYNDFQMGLRIIQSIANNLYVYNWLAAKVVDIPIDDATRKWRTLLIPDADKKEEVEDLMKEFQVKDTINLAFKWARVFGGAAILSIIDGDDQEMPLEPEKVRAGALRNFIVLDRYNIYPSAINRDILSENFGRPEYYTVARGGQQIHHTRLFKVQGDIKTLLELEQQNYWGNSIFTTLWDPISDSQTVTQSIQGLVYEANVDVFRIQSLNALIAEGKDELVTKRLKLASEMKSIIHGIALDKEDEYDKKQNSFMQLPQIDDRFIQKVSGASNIPVTRLLGTSPAGQNATGESDMLNYYDFIQSIQENIMRPAIDWMDSIILASTEQDIADFDYEFLPLKQLTETEAAEVESKRATRDQVYLDQDIINSYDVLAQLSEDGTYVTIDDNRVEEEKDIAELEEELDLVTPDPVPPVIGEPDPEEDDGEEEIRDEELTESEKSRKGTSAQVKAQNFLNSALRSGKAKKPIKCDNCGNKKDLQAHHNDYSKPLQVEWYCQSCHGSNGHNKKKYEE